MHPADPPQPSAQVTVSKQLATPHAPQSALQVKQLSKLPVSHVPSPQVIGVHVPQSTAQLMQVSSVPSQKPSPQQLPQSMGQTLQSSLNGSQ